MASELLGCVLRNTTSEGRAAGIIVETEAYLGPLDNASHARFGSTGRSHVMFGPPGVAYVYLIYGMHYMFNAVTEDDGRAGAVLIRALEPTEGLPLMTRRRGQEDRAVLTKGPARLTRALGIDIDHNQAVLNTGPLGIWEGERDEEAGVFATRRVNVVGSKELHLRFLINGNPYVSR